MTEALIALVLATGLLLGSPGPAPLALAAVGAAQGIRGGLRFLLGILVGLTVTIMGAAVGLGALFVAYPAARIGVQLAGALYIVYVAFKIATGPVIAANSDDDRAGPTFVDGFILNISNPKAYAAFLALYSHFLLPLPTPITAFVATAVVCLVVAAAVDFAWLCLGGVIGPIFRQPRQARAMRVSFAVLMLVAVIWALFAH